MDPLQLGGGFSSRALSREQLYELTSTEVARPAGVTRGLNELLGGTRSKFDIARIELPITIVHPWFLPTVAHDLGLTRRQLDNLLYEGIGERGHGPVTLANLALQRNPRAPVLTLLPVPPAWMRGSDQRSEATDDRAHPTHMFVTALQRADRVRRMTIDNQPTAVLSLAQVMLAEVVNDIFTTGIVRATIASGLSRSAERSVLRDLSMIPDGADDDFQNPRAPQSADVWIERIELTLDFMRARIVELAPANREVMSCLLQCAGVVGEVTN